MISLGARLVRAALRLYTYPYRKRHASLSRSVKFRSRPYRPPAGFSWERTEADGVCVEILTPPDCRKGGAVLHFHGGGHTVGMNGMYRKVAERLARGTRRPVYSVDYRTGEALTHPALLDECFRAVLSLREKGPMPAKWAAVGDSMGANLMLAVCLRLRDEGMELPAALVCVSPFVDLAAAGDSYRKNAHADPLYGLPKNKVSPKTKSFCGAGRRTSGPPPPRIPISRPPMPILRAFRPFSCNTAKKKLRQATERRSPPAPARRGAKWFCRNMRACSTTFSISFPFCAKASGRGGKCPPF